MGRRRLWAAALGVSATIYSLMAPTVVLGATCNPGRGGAAYNGHTGVAQNIGQSPVYIRANILETDVLTAPNGDVTAWPMLVRFSPNTRYAQVGWRKNPNLGGRDVFIQYIDDSGNTHTPAFLAKTLGTYTKYEVRAVVGGKAFLAGGIQLLSVANATWAPTQMQFFGETHIENDQMPGVMTNREEFSNAQYSFDLRTWTNISNAAAPTMTDWYGVQKVSNGVYRIWDTCHA